MHEKAAFPSVNITENIMISGKSNIAYHENCAPDKILPPT